MGNRMRLMITLGALFLCARLIGAEFSLAIKEASYQPQAGFVEHAFDDQKVYVGPDSGITEKNVTKLTYHDLQGTAILGINFTAEGTRLNHAFTSRMKRKSIAIFVNQRLVSVPMVIEPSIDECRFTGLSKEEIDDCIAAFNKR